MGSRIPSINSRYIRILLAAHVSLIFQDAFKPGTWGAMSQPPPTRMRAGWAFSAGCILRLCLFKITQGNKEWALKMAAPQTKQHWTYHFTLKTHVFLDFYVTFGGGLVCILCTFCAYYMQTQTSRRFGQWKAPTSTLDGWDCKGVDLQVARLNKKNTICNSCSNWKVDGAVPHFWFLVSASHLFWPFPVSNLWS